MIASRRLTEQNQDRRVNPDPSAAKDIERDSDDRKTGGRRNRGTRKSEGRNEDCEAGESEQDIGRDDDRIATFVTSDHEHRRGRAARGRERGAGSKYDKRPLLRHEGWSKQCQDRSGAKSEDNE